MKEAILETKNLDYKYISGEVALKDISLKIHRGETVAILGGNGAGKSTLFQCFNGILRPTSGELLVASRTVKYTASALKELRRTVGLVFQDSDSQLFSASVYQDVSFGAVNLKLPLEEIRLRVDTALKRTGTLHLKDRPTHSLSFGEKKRVAIAGVLVMEPQIIVLDEPTAGLDPKGVSEIMTLLKETQKQLGISIVLSTHDIDLVGLYCDYVYVLEKGRLILEGRPREVFDRADILRSAHLRLPRIGHLMEILKKHDGFSFQQLGYTIAEARRELRNWYSSKTKQGEK